MGCGSSLTTDKVILVPVQNGERVRQIPLVKAKKEAIRESWKLVEPVKSSAGRTMFMRLFTDYPSAQSKFPTLKNISLNDLVRSREFVLHSRRVMNAVENAVSALDDGEVFITYLEELGRRHAPALMKKNMFAIVESAIISTFKDMLGDHFTTEVEEAWRELLAFMANTMLGGVINDT